MHDAGHHRRVDAGDHCGSGLRHRIARSFFFISKRDWKLSHWAERGLQYAPIAALAAVIIPEIVMSQGMLTATLKDARLYGAAAGIAVFYWRKSTLGCIIGGMAVYLPLHVGLGW